MTSPFDFPTFRLVTASWSSRAVFGTLAIWTAPTTFVDGKPCQSGCVRPDSVLAIGRHRFVLAYQAEGEPPTEPGIVKEVSKDSLLSKAGIDCDSSADQTIEPEAKPAQSKNRGRLYPLGGGAPISLNQDHLLVGRDRGCDIRLQLAAVSSRHCELEFIEGFWMVRDLGSHNGTKVNGKKIEQKWLLPGSVLQISKLRLKVMYFPTPGAPVPKDTGVSFTRSLLERAGLKKRRSE